MKSALLFSAAFVSLATAAHAGQRFSFTDPIVGGSYSNSMFQTGNLDSDNSAPTASFQNLYSNLVTLTVDNFTSTGAYSGSNSVAAKFYVTKSTSANSNDIFGGPITSGAYATGAGRVVFVNPSNEAQVYLQVGFNRSALLYSGLTATQTISFAGSLFSTVESGNEKAAFSLTREFVNGDLPTRRTGTFLASIGTIGTVQTTPEPASLAAMATGALTLLRRRRR